MGVVDRLGPICIGWAVWPSTIVHSYFYSAPSIFAVFRNLVQKIWFKKSSLRKVVLQTRIFFWFEKSRWSEKQCHTNFCNQRCFCTYLQFWTVREDTALSLLEAWGCKVLGYSQRNFLPTLNTKILFFCLPPSQSCRHNNFCSQKCFFTYLQFWTVCEDTALSLLEAWGRKVLGLSPRNSLLSGLN